MERHPPINKASKQTMRRNIVFTITLLVILSFTVSVFSDSIRWTCPVCKQTLQFDPRNKGYAQSMKQQHLAAHKNARQVNTATPGSWGDPMLDAAQPVLEQFFHDLFWGPDPAEQKRIEAEEARLRAEREAAALEEARRREIAHGKLMGSMKTLSDSNNDLGIKSGPSKAGSLSLKGLRTYTLGGGTVLENLQRAAYLMQQAANCTSKGDAAFLSEEAFRAAQGEKLYVDVPPIGPAGPVTAEDTNIYLKLKQEIETKQLEYIKLSDELARKHHRQNIFKQAKQAAERRVEKQETKLKSMPEDTDHTVKAEEDHKLAEARKLLEEATRFENKAAEDLQRLQKETDQLNNELTKKEDQRRNFIQDLSKK